MKNLRVMRFVKTLTTGVILLQAGGCTLTPLNEFLQTIFLGITAAGSLAILENI